WVKIYEESGYDDNVFNSKKGRPKSIISDISKVPPFIYESAGIIRNDSNKSNDSASLKKRLEYYERLLLEKELLIKMQEDEINF
ncbi:transposase, partial [Thermosipho africanus Ob7]